jgi:hypothetical protein
MMTIGHGNQFTKSGVDSSVQQPADRVRFSFSALSFERHRPYNGPADGGVRFPEGHNDRFDGFRTQILSDGNGAT